MSLFESNAVLHLAGVFRDPVQIVVFGANNDRVSDHYERGVRTRGECLLPHRRSGGGIEREDSLGVVGDEDALSGECWRRDEGKRVFIADNTKRIFALD